MTSSALETWGFTTPEMSEVFSAGSVVGAMLEFERSLSLSLVDAGIAPHEQASAVAAACEAPLEDPESILGTTWDTGTPVIALLDEVRSRLETDEERRWLHHGSTTQDVMDTAYMLLSSRALEQLILTLERISVILRRLAEMHRTTPQIGRTLLQHARPTSFGLRVVGWLEPTLTHIETLTQTRSRLPAQLGGPVGDRAVYGARALDVATSLAGRLGLRPTHVAWHTDRSSIREMAGAVGNMIATMAKIANDVVLLAQSDSSEIEVRPGASSSMGEKRNPIDAIRALASAEISSGMVSTLLGARPIELDRGTGGWQLEWAMVPLMFESAAATLDAVESMLESLTVNEDVMAGRAGPDSDSTIRAIDQRQFDAVIDRSDSILGGR